MAAKVKTWVWVVVGIVVLGILGVIAVAAAGIYYFSRHIDTTTTTPVAAAQEFDEVKARFSGQTPLIELDEHGRPIRSSTDRPPPANTRAPTQIHVLVFDPDDGRIVRLTIPFWLLRLNIRGTTFDVDGRRMDLEEMKLTVEDLERLGPALIVEHVSPSGDRVLVWSQ